MQNVRIMNRSIASRILRELVHISLKFHFQLRLTTATVSTHLALLPHLQSSECFLTRLAWHLGHW
jgi:hypothetical protein